jgi:hypothetical protein
MSGDGSRVAVGAILGDGPNNIYNLGTGSIYEFNAGTGTWIRVGQTITGHSNYDQSGHSVSLSSDGTRVAIGAPFNDGNGNSSGHTRIYEWNSGTSTWTQMGQDIEGEAADDSSGWSVSLSSDGTRVAIAEPFYEEMQDITDTGRVRVYEWNSGTSTWIQLGGNLDDRNIYNRKIKSVAISGDGTTVILGTTENFGEVSIMKYGVVYPGALVIGDNPYYMQLGSTYTDPGTTSTSGTITVDTSRLNTNTKGLYTVYYYWKSASSYVSIILERFVRVAGPILTLNGPSNISALPGSVYTEYGATSDGGELVIIDLGGLNTDVLGIYTITYSSTDEFSLTNSVTRLYGVYASFFQQMGQNIYGEAVNDSSGWSVSLSSDGTRVAIGAYANDGNGNSSGHTRIYEWNSGTSTWTQMGQDIDGEASNDRSGWSVSLSSDGTRVAIGAIYNDGNGTTDSGHTRIYEWNSGTSTWTQMGQDIDGEAAYDSSGWSVSLSSDGTRVAIGAIYNDGNGTTDSGHTRIYEWNSGTSTWTQMGQDIDGEAAVNESGNSVSLSSDGTRVAIGSRLNNGNGTADSGHTRIYEWNSGTSTWTQMGQDIDGEAAYDRSGWSVSLSSDGTRVAIGAYANDGNGIESGHTRIYEWNSGTSTWTQMGQDIDGEAVRDRSGISVSLSSDGTRVAIGAYLNSSTSYIHSGHVRLYRWNGARWIQMGQDIEGEQNYDYFGYSVSISGDGTRVAAGAYDNDRFIANSGSVRVLEYVTDEPIITLIGDNPYIVSSGTVYTDPGATSDGGETVTIDTSNLNMNQTGVYIVDYTSTKSNNVTGYASRYVEVV